MLFQSHPSSFSVSGPNAHLFKQMKLWIQIYNLTLAADLEGTFPLSHLSNLNDLPKGCHATLLQYRVLLWYRWGRGVSAVQALDYQQGGKKKKKGTREGGWRELHTLEIGPGWRGRQQRSGRGGTGEDQVRPGEAERTGPVQQVEAVKSKFKFEVYGNGFVFKGEPQACSSPGIDLFFFLSRQKTTRGTTTRIKKRKSSCSEE